jgi:hypothetical protein
MEDIEDYGFDLRKSDPYPALVECLEQLLTGLAPAIFKAHT